MKRASDFVRRLRQRAMGGNPGSMKKLRVRLPGAPPRRVIRPKKGKGSYDRKAEE